MEGHVTRNRVLLSSRCVDAETHFDRLPGRRKAILGAVWKPIGIVQNIFGEMNLVRLR